LEIRQKRNLRSIIRFRVTAVIMKKQMDIVHQMQDQTTKIKSMFLKRLENLFWIMRGRDIILVCLLMDKLVQARVIP
jgi:hypothetical protein